MRPLPDGWLVHHHVPVILYQKWNPLSDTKHLRHGHICLWGTRWGFGVAYVCDVIIQDLPLTVTSDHLHNGSSSRYSLTILKVTSMAILPKYRSIIFAGSSPMLENSTKNPSLYEHQVFSLSVLTRILPCYQNSSTICQNEMRHCSCRGRHRYRLSFRILCPVPHARIGSEHTPHWPRLSKVIRNHFRMSWPRLPNQVDLEMGVLNSCVFYYRTCTIWSGVFVHKPYRRPTFNGRLIPGQRPGSAGHRKNECPADSFENNRAPSISSQEWNWKW